MTTEIKNIQRVSKTTAQIEAAGIIDEQWGYSTDDFRAIVRQGDNYYHLAGLSSGTNAFTGSATFGGTLGVTGLITASAGLTTAGGSVTLGAGDDLIGSSTSDITINTNKFTVAGATGNTIIAGTLGVTGNTTVSAGDLTVSSGTLSVTASGVSEGIDVTNTASNATIGLNASSTDDARLDFNTNGSIRAYIGWDHSEGILKLNGDGQFSASNNLTIDTSGNVTVGDGDLTVSSGSISVNSGTTDIVGTFQSTDANAWLYIKDSATTLGNVAINAVSNAMRLYGGGNYAVEIDASGNVSTLAGNFSVKNGHDFSVVGGNVNLQVPDNDSNAYIMGTSTEEYISLNTANAIETLDFGNATTNPDFNFLGTGDVTVGGSLVLSEGTQDYSIEARSDATTQLFFSSKTAATDWILNTATEDADGTDNNLLQMFAVGKNGSLTNSEYLQIGYSASGTEYVIAPGITGSGTRRGIKIGSSVSNINVDANLGVATFTAMELATVASTTTRPSINIPHGTAPTAPTDGDMWTTTAGLYVRINGVTVGPLS